MSSFGIGLEGINVKTLEDVLSELDDSHRVAFGPAINTSPASVLGQLDSIFGDKIAELWELAAAVYASQYPDTAQGASLDYVSAITGAIRLAAQKSTVTLRANLNPGTILNVGRIVSVSATGARFVTTEQVQNATGVPANIAVEAESEEYGAIVGSSGTIDTIETPVSGWTAQAAIDSSLSEPFTLSNGQTLQIKVDGELTAQVVTFVTGDFIDIGNALATEIVDAIVANTTGIDGVDAGGKVRLFSETDGPGSSIQITGGSANPQIGFDTTLVAGMNDLDAELGNDIESDQAFRVRREELLRISGAATVEAIRAAIREVLGVVQAYVFENVTLVTDVNGLPPKSFEAVVSGGDDTEVAQTIFDSKPVGIETYADPGPNAVQEFITDSQGIVHEINFSRPTDVPMYVDVDITVDGAVFGGGSVSAGEQQVKESIAALGQEQEIGEDVTILRYKCAALDVTGVLDVGLTEIEDTFPPTNTANIVIGVRDLATFDTSNIRVYTTVI